MKSKRPSLLSSGGEKEMGIVGDPTPMSNRDFCKRKPRSYHIFSLARERLINSRLLLKCINYLDVKRFDKSV